MKCPLCCSQEFYSKKEVADHLRLILGNVKCPICHHQFVDLVAFVCHLDNVDCSESKVLHLAQAEPDPRHEDSISTNEGYPSEDVSMNSSFSIAKESKSLPVRKRRRSNMSQLGKRKTVGKNSLNESGEFLSQSKNTVASGSNHSVAIGGYLSVAGRSNHSVVTGGNLSVASGSNHSVVTGGNLSVANGSNHSVVTGGNLSVASGVATGGNLSVANGSNHSVVTGGNISVANGNNHSVNTVVSVQNVVLGAASLPAQSSAAESEIDVDNISMQSDESSFTTTNDYSSSQNEILSDDDCNDNPARSPYLANSGRHTPVFRNNERQGCAGFINNLLVINNFQSSSRGNASGNYQRRNTKNNNNRQINNSQVSTSSNFSNWQARKENNIDMTRNNVETVASTSSEQGLIRPSGPGNSNGSNGCPQVNASGSTDENDRSEEDSGGVRTVPVSSVQVNSTSTQKSTSPLTIPKDLFKIVQSPCNFVHNANTTSKCKVTKYNKNGTDPEQRTNDTELTITSTQSATSTDTQTTEHQVASGTNRHDSNRPHSSEEPASTLSGPVISAQASNPETSQNVENVVSSSVGTEVLSVEVGTSVEHEAFSDVEDTEDTISSQPMSLNNLNNSTTSTAPAASHNICSLTNNLHKNKKSNLNQLGRQNVKEEKMFTAGKAQATVSTSEGATGGYQINNSIERNFNKLNSCSQEINAHKNVKTTKNRRVRKPVRRLQLEQSEARNQNEPLRTRVSNTSSSIVISGTSLVQATSTSHNGSTSHNTNSTANNSISGINTNSTTMNSILGINTNSTVNNSTLGVNANSATNNSNLGINTNTTVNNSTLGVNANSATNNSNVGINTNSTVNNSTSGVNASSATNNSNLGMITNTPEASGSANINNAMLVSQSKTVGTKKELLNMTRNNFSLSQDHSNVRRSNSLNVRNELPASSAQSHSSNHPARRTVVKSNSFNIRNNFSQLNTSDFSQERPNRNLKNVNWIAATGPPSNSRDTCKGLAPITQEYSSDTAPDRGPHSTSRDDSSDTPTSSSRTNSNDETSISTPIDDSKEEASTSNSKQNSRDPHHPRDSTLDGANSIRDDLEMFRLEEASNDGCNIPDTSEPIKDSENLTDPLEAFSGLVLNNCLDNVENQSKACSSGAGPTNPQMIHNNFEPRSKKNKKCNEERDPLKPINLANKPKSNDQ